jgi:hypothetical protein
VTWAGGSASPRSSVIATPRLARNWLVPLRGRGIDQDTTFLADKKNG